MLEHCISIAFTRRTFIGKVMSLLFNILSRLVVTFLPRNKRLSISWGAGCGGPLRSEAVRSYPSSKVRGSHRERQAGTAQELVERRGTPLRGWLRGATPRPGRGRRPRGATPRPRSGSCARAERSYPTFKVRSGHHDEIPLVQGKEQRLRFAGAAVKRYPTSKVRETQVRR